jgi:hypothetical protein
MISPAGSRSARVTWWRAAAEAEGVFASVCDISSFPTAGISSYRSTWGTGRARTAAVRPGGPRPENNFAPRNCGPACAFNGQRRVVCPPAPNPSPIRRETLARVRRRGLPLWTVVRNRQRKLAAPLAMRCASALPMRARVGAGLADLSLRDETRRASLSKL